MSEDHIFLEAYFCSDCSDMIVHSTQDSEVESDFSYGSSDDLLNIDLGYFPQNSYSSEKCIKYKTAPKLQIASDNSQTCSGINLEDNSNSVQSFGTSEFTIDSEYEELSEIKHSSFKSNSLLTSNTSFESVSNKSFSEIEKSKHSEEIDVDFLNRLKTSNFFNASQSNLQINSVYTLSHITNISEKDNSVSPLNVDTDSKIMTENGIEDPVSNQLGDFVSFEKNKRSSVLKENFDNNMDKSTVSSSIMDDTSPSKSNVVKQVRPKLKSIFFGKRKLPQFECSFLGKEQTKIQSQNISNIETSRKSDILELQTNCTGELGVTSKLEREEGKENGEIHLQRYSASSSKVEVNNTSDKGGELHTSKNLSSMVEEAMKLQSDRFTQDTFLKAAKSHSVDDEDPIETTSLQYFSSSDDHTYKDLSYSSLDNDEDSNFAKENTSNSFSSREKDVTDLLNATDSDDTEEDGPSMRENVLRYFSTQSKEEIIEMFNATKFGPIQMTLRNRPLKKSTKKEDKTITTIIPKKSRPKRKALSQNHDDIKRKKRWSVKIKKKNSSRCVKKYVVNRYVPESLPCDICERTFPSWPGRIKHWLITKHKVPEMCNWCNKNFFFLHKHIVNAHPSVCKYCGKIFVHPDDKVKHREEHVNNTIYCCNECQHSADSEEQFRLHMETHFGKQLHICEFCEKDFTGEELLKEHLSFYHFECDLCNFQCYYKSHFKEHMKKHNGKAPFMCSVCDRVCSNEKTLKYHILGKHKNIRPYKCNTCNKMFVLKNKLADHIKTHEGHYYICKICGQYFLEERYLMSHEEDHNIFICNFCNAEYTLKYNMLNHLRGSAGDGFVCQKCELDCNCRTGYEEHIKMHEKKGEMTAVCQFCDIEFKSNHTLKRHMSISHPLDYAKINVQAETCKYCGHICSSRHQRLKHIRLKHPVRKELKIRKVRDTNSPYECDICNMTFKYNGGYNKHIKSKKHKNSEMSQKLI